MEPVIDFVMAKPLYGAVAALLLIFLIVVLAKRAFKLAAIAFVLNGIYGYYLNDLANDFYQRVGVTLENAADRAGNAVESVRDRIR